MAAFRTDTLYVSGVYQTNQGEYDEDLVYIPLSSARRLFDYTTEITSLDVAVDEGRDPSDVAGDISRQARRSVCGGRPHAAAGGFVPHDTYREVDNLSDAPFRVGDGIVQHSFHHVDAHNREGGQYAHTHGPRSLAKHAQAHIS